MKQTSHSAPSPPPHFAHTPFSGGVWGSVVDSLSRTRGQSANVFKLL